MTGPTQDVARQRAQSWGLPPLTNPVGKMGPGVKYSEYITLRKQAVDAYVKALYSADGKDQATWLRRSIDLLDQGAKAGGSPLKMPARVGVPTSGEKACVAAQATRHVPGSPSQSYGNCGIESWRVVINNVRAKQGLPPITEDAMLQQAIAKGQAGSGDPTKSWTIGGSGPDGQRGVLKDYGIDASNTKQTPADIEKAIKDRKAIGVGVNPQHYWPNGQSGVHAVVVLGIERDAKGDIKSYVINDTGIGSCALRVPKEKFEAALIPGGTGVVTDAAVW